MALLMTFFQMNNKLISKLYKFLSLFFILALLNQCGMGADARKYPPEPEKRVKRNMEEGRGFRLMGGDKKNVGGNAWSQATMGIWIRLAILPAAPGSMLCKACVVHVDPTSRFDSADVPIGTFLPKV